MNTQVLGNLDMIKYEEELDYVKNNLQQQNFLPYFSMDHSSVPTTSSQIPGIPISSNVGNIIPHDGNKFRSYKNSNIKFKDTTRVHGCTTDW